MNSLISSEERYTCGKPVSYGPEHVTVSKWQMCMEVAIMFFYKLNSVKNENENVIMWQSVNYYYYYY